MSGQLTVPRRSTAASSALGPGGLPPQRRDKLRGEQAGFEFSGRQIGQVDALRQLNTCCFQIISSLWRQSRPSQCQYRGYYMPYL